MKITASICIIAGCVRAFEQQPASQPTPATGSVILHAGTNEVLLDIVVRDKKGSA